jgi:K+ transporter
VRPQTTLTPSINRAVERWHSRSAHSASYMAISEPRRFTPLVKSSSATAGFVPRRKTRAGASRWVIWALTIVVTIKYVVLVLRADNDGEGGVFALYGLLHRHRRFTAALSMLMLAAGLLFADGMLTPAISVLSAVEGLTVATPLFARASVPITIVL